MNFVWPEMLWLLLVVPALVFAYVVLLRRRIRNALRYASLGIIKDAAAGSPQVRRYVPPLLFLLALALTIFATARPTSMVTLPFQESTIILAIDVSASMRADDIAPTRLAAADAAVRSFIAAQPRHTRVGLVSFAATASVIQPPTHSREALHSALEKLQLQGGTAVGSGILVSLKTIFPDLEFDLRASDPRPGGHSRQAALGTSLDAAAKAPAQPRSLEPVPPGSHNSAAIILLTDGQATTGPDPIESARLAAERGVRVFTVGIGTANGEIVSPEGWKMRVRLDEQSLKRIASDTKAEYFYADNATDLSKIYRSLNARLLLEKKETELTALFTAAAALAALLSGVLSLLWFNRLL